MAYFLALRETAVLLAPEGNNEDINDLICPGSSARPPHPLKKYCIPIRMKELTTQYKAKPLGTLMEMKPNITGINTCII